MCFDELRCANSFAIFGLMMRKLSQMKPTRRKSRWAWYSEWEQGLASVGE